MRRAIISEGVRRSTCCCFAGIEKTRLRRPIDDIKVDLENEILRTIRKGYTTFITALAYETDIWAGNIVLRLRKDRFPELKLIVAIPFPEYDECHYCLSNEWTNEWTIEKYDILRIQADGVWEASPTRNEEAYQVRNEWMIDRCSRIIAIFDGKYSKLLQYATNLDKVFVEA